LELDPEFEFPGYGFNTGQIVASTGCITRKDFEGLMDWQTRIVNDPDIFKLGEQGLCNYVVLRKAQQGKLTIRRESFMVWPGELARARHIQLKDLTSESPHQQLIHWAGLAWGKTLKEMPRSEILLFFEKTYYRRIPFGIWLRQLRRVEFWIHRTFITPLKTMVKKGLSKGE
jgi:hypothetical protein